jgi:hypothetical protein
MEHLRAWRSSGVGSGRSVCASLRRDYLLRLDLLLGRGIGASSVVGSSSRTGSVGDSAAGFGSREMPSASRSCCTAGFARAGRADSRSAASGSADSSFAKSRASGALTSGSSSADATISWNCSSTGAVGNRIRSAFDDWRGRRWSCRHFNRDWGRNWGSGRSGFALFLRGLDEFGVGADFHFTYSYNPLF